MHFPNFVHQYLCYIYQSFYFLTGGEVVPQSNDNSVSQTVICCSALVISSILNNLLLGFFSILSEDLTRKATELQQKMDLTNTAMNNLGLPFGLRNETLIFIQNTHNT